MNGKNLRRWLVLGGLLALFGVAYADFNVQDKGTYYNNASTGARTNSTGSALSQEVDPTMDANLTFTNIIQNSGLAIGAADSSIVLDTHRMRLGMLLIKATPTGTGTVDTTVVMRLAFQVRTHLDASSDSSNTFAIYQYGNLPAAVATSFAADTSYQGHIYAGTPITAIAATPGANTAWSGEFTVLVSAKRSAHGNAISVNGHTFYYPNGIAIPLQSLFGRDMFSPFTSVRVRLMTAQKGAASLTTATCAVTVHLVGSPL